MPLTIEVAGDGKDLLMRFSPHDQEPVLARVVLDDQEDGAYHVYEVLRTLFPSIYPYLPSEHLEVHLSEDLLARVPLISHLQDCLAILDRTNLFLLEHRSLKDCALPHKDILFYNINENERFKDLYQNVCQAAPEHVHLINGTTGSADNSFLSPADMLDVIQRLKVQRIISSNMYYLVDVLNKHRIYLPAVMAYLGVEYIIYDEDIYDGNPVGYLAKAAFNWKDFRRFSVMPFMQSYWDRVYGLKNVSYEIYFRSAPREEKMPELAEDFSLLILSHSRVELVMAHLESVIYVLSRMTAGNVFDELRLWYFSLLSMILETEEIPLKQRMDLNYRIYWYCYVAALQFLKFDLIDGVKTTRPRLIFGDDGWGKVFPEYYQGRYLKNEEKEERLSDRRHLYLLLNENHSYLECHPVIHDAIHRNIPFVTFPPISRMPALEGMRRVEYGNAEDLSRLLHGVNGAMRDEAYQGSLKYLKSVLKECGQGLVSGIVGEKRSEKPFERYREEQEPSIQARIEAYRESHLEVLEETYSVLILGKETSFSLESSPYLGRPYVRKLFELSARARESSEGTT